LDASQSLSEHRLVFDLSFYSAFNPIILLSVSLHRCDSAQHQNINSIKPLHHKYQDG
jgi:hypothetical protein